MQSYQTVMQLIEKIDGKEWTSALRLISGLFQGKAVLTTSFGMEDQAILDAISRLNLDVRVVTLDTGRLFEETHSLHALTLEKYKLPVEVFFPDPTLLGELITRQGPNGFYDSVEKRHACCHVRKVEPVRRALAGAQLWITGIRREQSPEREDLKAVEWDSLNNLIKYHPLLDVSTEELNEYVVKHRVPLNPLHAMGFPSIGCAPCTRAVAPSEPVRRGRWWWEEDARKECGLHVQDGRLVRNNSRER